MSTELSEEFAALALEMLGEDGVAVTVRAGNTGAINAAGDRAAPAAPRASVGLILPDKGTAVVDGSEKPAERVIMAPVDPWPTPGERLTINGRSLTVADGVKTYAPQGLAIMHDLLVAS